MKKVKIDINKKTELLGVLFRLSDYQKKYSQLNGTYKTNSEYIKFMSSWFEKFKDHQTVKMFNEIVNTLNFSYNAPVELFLDLKDDYSVGILSEKNFYKRLKASSLVLEMLNSLKDFVRETKFEDYYDKNKKYYDECKKLANIDLNEKYDVYKMLSSFYGEAVNELNLKINLLPFATGGSFGPTLNNQPYPCISISRKTERGPYFGTEYIPHIIHEFSHHFINPITDKYIDIANKINYSNENKENMRKIAYTNNKVITNEYVVRAVTSTICKPYMNKSLIEYDYNVNIKNAFTHIDFFLNKIKENAQKGKHISDYCETLLTEFSQYMENVIELAK